ncbi:MAG: hypothetical protein P4K83_11650 [Terracidiphilus sp.]|nr:hypothetical protein [Terracidiphilus sp.]
MHEDAGVAPVTGSAQCSGEAGADELSRQLLSWSHLWAGLPTGSETGNRHRLVRERLAAWLERCIGRHTRGLLTIHPEDLSLAASTPLLTAFLGRRATRELSRQVLRDM